MNAKEMIARNNKKKTKFFRNDRVKMEVIKDTFIKTPEGEKPGFVKGQIITPHRLMGEQLEIDKIAVAL